MDKISLEDEPLNISTFIWLSYCDRGYSSIKSPRYCTWHQPLIHIFGEIEPWFVAPHTTAYTFETQLHWHWYYVWHARRTPFFFYCLAMLTQSLGCIWHICKQHLCWLSSGYLWTSTYVLLFLWNFKSSSLVTLFNYFVVEEPFLFKFKILKTYSGMPIMLWHIWILYMLVVYFYSSWKS